MLEKARSRDALLENRRILIVEDDVRNVFAVTNFLEPRGVTVQIARNGIEAIQAIEKSAGDSAGKIDLVLMDVMMPEMDGLTATRESANDPNGKNCRSSCSRPKPCATTKRIALPRARTTTWQNRSTWRSCSRSFESGCRGDGVPAGDE